jgi:hypothetical protein
LRKHLQAYVVAGLRSAVYVVAVPGYTNMNKEVS